MNRDAVADVMVTIDRAPTFWALTRDLLCLWRASPGSDGSPHAAVGDRWHTWADLEHEVVSRFEGPRDPDELSRDERRWMQSLVAGGGADALHALAWGLSVATAATFAPAWRDELSGSPRLLADGEAYPVADVPWHLADDYELPSRPASLASPTDELPTVRIHDGSFDVWVDVDLERSLEAIAMRLEQVAAIHPNERWEELDLHEPRRGIVYPVTPRDEAAQSGRLVPLVEQVAHEAGLAVLPELSVTPLILGELATAVGGVDLPFLLVAGSQHVEVDGRPANEAHGLLAGTRRRMLQHKNVPFSIEVGSHRPRKEGIQQRERIRVAVYPADRFRFAIAICRDLLDGRVRAAYDRMGVNVLAVPAMSEKVEPFVGAAESRVAAAQGLTFVVNGPLHDSRGRRLAFDGVLGQPVSGMAPTAFAGSPGAATLVQTLLRQ